MLVTSLNSRISNQIPKPDDLCLWAENRAAWHAHDRLYASAFAKVSGELERRMVGDGVGKPRVASAYSSAWGASAYAVQAAAWRTSVGPALQDPHATVFFDKRFTLEGQSLGSRSFTSSAPQDSALQEQAHPGPIAPAATTPSKALPTVQGAGAVVAEDDGRVWLCEPAGGFGGHDWALPKGYHDGRDMATTARSEVAEELGLQVQLIAPLGVFSRNAAGRKHTQFYLARREGGDPACAHWESFGSALTPVGQAFKLLTNPWDRAVLQEALYASPPTLRRSSHGIDAWDQLQNFLPPSANSPASEPTPTWVLAGPRVEGALRSAYPTLLVHALEQPEDVVAQTRNLSGDEDAAAPARVLVVDDCEEALGATLAASHPALRCVGVAIGGTAY